MRSVVDVWVDRAVPGLRDAVRDADSTWSVEVVDHRSSARIARATIAGSRPDIVVVGPQLTSASSLMCRLGLAGSRAGAQCVLGSGGSTDAVKILAQRRGFFDIIDTDMSAPDVVERMRSICAGESLLRRDRLWDTVETYRPSADVDDVVVDAIDHDIIELVSLGVSDRDIALGVHLSVQTVRNRVSAMIQRAGCANRTHLGWLFTDIGMTELLSGGSERED